MMDAALRSLEEPAPTEGSEESATALFSY